MFSGVTLKLALLEFVLPGNGVLNHTQGGKNQHSDSSDDEFEVRIDRIFAILNLLLRVIYLWVNTFFLIEGHCPS